MQPYSNYKCIFVKDTSINVDRLDESIKEFLNYLEQELLRMSASLIERGEQPLSVVITCGYQQRRASSLHNYGKAVDFSIYNKNRQQVHAEWTISNWSILKRAIKSINREYNGRGVFQVIFESTDQSILDAARSQVEPNFIVLDTPRSTGPHFHVQYRVGRGSSSSPVRSFSLPEEIVDSPSVDTTSTPVSSTCLKFLYDGPTIRLYDLIETHPVFRNYRGEDGKVDHEKLGTLIGFRGTDHGGVSNYTNFYNQWFPAGTTTIYFINEFGDSEILTSDEFKERYEFKYSVGNYLIKNGTLIMLPPGDSNFLTTLALENGTRNQVSYFEDFPAFISEKREIMENDSDYTPVVTSNDVDYVSPDFTVWIYSHLLDSVLNITSLCKNVIVTSPIEGFNSATINLSFDSIDHYGKSDARVVVDKFRISRFSEVFTTQALIWIRFESLNCEDFGLEELDYYQGGVFQKVPFTELPGKYYDFIGFVNNIYEVQNSVSSVYNVTLTAFSLDWALELDKSIFMPLAIMINNTGSGSIGLTDSSNNYLMKRLSSQGEFLQLSQKILYTFEEVVKFYFGQIVQVGFADDKIFSGYGDRRSTLFEFYPDTLKDTVRETFAKGIYQIFKVEIDDYLKGRYFSDRNIALPNGSVYSLIKSICVPPLVEVFSDTYGDTHHLVIRKPPFDYKSIKQYLDKIESDPNGFNTVKTTDVYSTELKWEDNFYTWFQIIPEGATPSVGEYINLLFQIIFIDDYVKTWGSRGLQFSDPYLRDIESDQGNSFSETKAQIISDFIYILESHLYLPFTRKGRIILNKGDRRIKKGTWIKYEPTNELFYVEKVDQKVSVSGQIVSRQTILTVSRGMRINWIHPPQKLEFSDTIYQAEDGKYYKTSKGLYPGSYFGIVFLENLKEDLIKYINDPDRLMDLSMKNILFNERVFDDLFHRQQFMDDQYWTSYTQEWYE